jgi:hypothetical protein
MSRLEEIRISLRKYKGTSKELKHELIQWLTGVPTQRYHLAVTVQPTKMLYVHKSARHGFKSLDAYRCKGRNRIMTDGRDLVEKLNHLVYGNAYRRYGKKLDVVMVLEGKKSNKDLHLHFAIQVPKDRDYLDVTRCIKESILFSGEFQIDNPLYRPTHTEGSSIEKYRYKIAPIYDEGWITYITKELGPDSNNEINLEFPV